MVSYGAYDVNIVCHLFCVMPDILSFAVDFYLVLTESPGRTRSLA